MMVKLWVLGALALLLTGCGEEAIAPTGIALDPSVTGVDPAAAHYLLRIVEPRRGAVRTVERKFPIRAIQQIQTGPTWGLLQLQRSAGEDSWIDFGPKCPWSRQDVSIVIPWAEIDEPGPCQFRLVVCEAGSEIPFLVSSICSVTGIVSDSEPAKI